MKKLSLILVLFLLIGCLRIADPYDPDRNAPDRQEQRDEGPSE